MTAALKAALAVAALAAFGAVGAALWVGARSFEGTVVEDPFDSAVHFDEERHRAQALGWRLLAEGAPLKVGTQSVQFSLAERDGAPLEGAQARVSISRPGTAREDRTVAARPEGGGRFAASLTFPEPGIWDLEFRAQRGPDRLVFERRVQVDR